jgi:hypothetical protein
LEEKMMMPVEKEREEVSGMCSKQVEWVGGTGRDAWTFGNR